MALRIRVTTKAKKLSGLKFLQDKLTEGTADTLLDVARYALGTATEHTPKWSGKATEGWRISLVSRSGYTDNTNHTISSPRFPEGMEDSGAQALNRSVVERELDYLRSVLKGRLRQGKSAFYLVNDAAYSYQWLNHQYAGLFLRGVNQDFYTIKDIEAAVRQYRLGTRLGGWV